MVSTRASEHGRGFILMWRKTLTSAVFKNPFTWKVFSWCLMRANYQPIPWELRGEQIHIKRGQFVTGRISASDELGMSESTVYRQLKKIQKMGAISLEPNNRFTIVTICNYNTYQDPAMILEQQGEQQETQQENNKRHTNKEVNNTRNEEHKPHGEDLENPKDPKDEKQSLEFHLLTHWGNDGRMGWGVMTKFIDLQRKHGEQKVRDAIEIAGEMNKKSFAYVRGIVEGGKDNSQKEIDKFLGRTK